MVSGPKMYGGYHLTTSSTLLDPKGGKEVPAKNKKVAALPAKGLGNYCII